VDVKARFAVVADRNVPDRTQDFALFVDFDLLIGFLLEVEPTDGGSLEGTDGRQGCRCDLGVICEFRQCRKRFFAGFKNDDAGLCSRVAGYFPAFHDRYAALRRVWRPSFTSSMILALKASRSPGLRDVMTP
jgi:hypothetical protein